MFMIVRKYASHRESWAYGGRREHRSLDLGLQAVEPSDAGPLQEQKTLLSAETPSLQPLHVILIIHSS